MIQFIVNGLITGSIYALASVGFALVYNTTRIFHISYAAIFLISPYFFISFYNDLGFNFILAFLIATIFSALISLMIEVVIYRPLGGKKSSYNIIMISSIGAMIVITNIIAIIYGNETQMILSGISISYRIGNIVLTHNQVLQISVSLIVLTAFFVFFRNSKFGLKTRSLRDDPELFTVMGFDLYKIRNAIFIISGIFIAVCSNLIAIDIGIDPFAGMYILLNAIAALIIGGIGRFDGPILGGFIIGLLQSLTMWAFSARWQDAITFLVLILFLIFRRQGILGENRRVV